MDTAATGRAKSLVTKSLRCLPGLYGYGTRRPTSFACRVESLAGARPVIAKAVPGYDVVMSSSMQISGRRRGGWGVLVLLVMAVLAGVLGMHALAPGGAPALHDSAGYAAVASPGTGGHEAGTACSHADDRPEHLNHADGTCAAGGIGSPYVPPPLPVVLTDEPAATLPGRAPGASESGRAPPDLAELQILRV